MISIGDESELRNASDEYQVQIVHPWEPKLSPDWDSDCPVRFFYAFFSIGRPAWTYFGCTDNIRSRFRSHGRLKNAFSHLMVLHSDAWIERSIAREIEARVLRTAFKRWPWTRWINIRDLTVSGVDRYKKPGNPALMAFVEKLLDEMENLQRGFTSFSETPVKFPELTHVMEDREGDVFAFGSRPFRQRKFLVLSGSRLPPEIRSANCLGKRSGTAIGYKNSHWHAGLLARRGTVWDGSARIYYTRDVEYRNLETAACDVRSEISSSYVWRKINYEEAARYPVLANGHRKWDVGHR